MTTLLTIACAALIVWYILGCLVLSLVDDEEQRLFKWARSGPPSGFTLVVMAWPYVAWKFRR